jgi:hypothetical protein
MSPKDQQWVDVSDLGSLTLNIIVLTDTAGRFVLNKTKMMTRTFLELILGLNAPNLQTEYDI